MAPWQEVKLLRGAIYHCHIRYNRIYDNAVSLCPCPIVRACSPFPHHANVMPGGQRANKVPGSLQHGGGDDGWGVELLTDGLGRSMTDRRHSTFTGTPVSVPARCLEEDVEERRASVIRERERGTQRGRENEREQDRARDRPERREERETGEREK